MYTMNNRRKAVLTLAVLFSLASGQAFASSYHGETSNVTSSNETLDELYATNKAAVTVTGSGTITFTPSGTADGEGAIDAIGGSVVTIGSSSSPYDSLTANGEILAENKSTVNLYAKEITINKGDDYAAVTATNGSTINIGTANTTSLTTTGEVLSTDGDKGAASSVTLTAGDVTLNYSPNPSVDSGSGGDEDHTLYADGGSSLAVNASGTVTIKGPIGAVDSGSSITVDGSTISLTHNTVGEEGVTYDYDLETRGIHVEDGASVRIGSDHTTSLAIDVENGSDDSSIVVSGDASKLELYGKTLSVTAEDGIYNGDITTEQGFNLEYKGGLLTIGSSSTESVAIDGGVIRTVGENAQTSLTASSSIAVSNVVSAYYGGVLSVGTNDTQEVSLGGVITSGEGSTASILGQTIFFAEKAKETYFNGGTGSVGAYQNGAITIGSDTTKSVNFVGSVHAGSGGSVTVLGNTLIFGSDEEDELSVISGGTMAIGDKNTASVILNGVTMAEGSSPDSTKKSILTVEGNTVTAKQVVIAYGWNSEVSLDGTNLEFAAAEGIPDTGVDVPVAAIMGGTLTIGSADTESIHTAGAVSAFAFRSLNTSYTQVRNTKITLDARTMTFDGGVTSTLEGAQVIIGGAGTAETVTGDLTADGGILTATLSGAYTGNATAQRTNASIGSYSLAHPGTLTLTAGSVTGNLTSKGSGSTLTATVSGTTVGDASAADSGNLTLTTGSLTGDLTTSDNGALAAAVSHTFTGKTTDDADTMTLTLNSGATWNLTDSSTVKTLNAEGANINLMDGTLGETLTAGSFAGDGATLYLDADGTTNMGNDHVYITGSHTGTTDLHLESTSNTWSGALGTVLVSVGNEEGSFVSYNETEAALYYYNLELASTSDNVTDGYSTDWYLKGFTKAPTNDEGHHTTVGRNLGGITGGNYLLWRSDMDTLFRRMGEADGSLTDNTDDGIWARAKGTKFSRSDDFLVDAKYNEYEVGYDWLDDKTDTKEHVTGIGFAYLDGDATYVTGTGDLEGYSLGLYDTQVWKNGQYLDLTFKASHYSNDFQYTALGKTIDGKVDSTGLTAGAEYGYKMKNQKGWFVEPQAQFVLGYFRNHDFTDSNGIHVDGETVRTALGRIGARIGYESPKASVYVKANWYHDFGGNHDLTLSVDTDTLHTGMDYGDTWFTYGLGAAYKINDTTQFYADLERGDGSSYDEDWSWDVGLRWNF